MKNIASAISGIIKDVTDSEGRAAVDRFSSLRHVDAKVREMELLLDSLPNEAKPLKERFKSDEDFSANSRRVRLEALTNYGRTALNFIEKGILKEEKQIFPCPDLSKFTSSIPGLEEIIKGRWIEAQRCMHVGSFLSSIIMMGSILEALLLGKAFSDQRSARQSSRAPKDKDGKVKHVHEWNLSALIDVAVDLGWIKVDRGKFSHSLRESRNVVHPWQHATLRADFDENTCKTCWIVLTSAVDDLQK